MAEVTIGVGGREYTLALPLGLDALEDAGDAIDRYRALAPEFAPFAEGEQQPPMRLVARASRAALEVFCIIINLKHPGAIDFKTVSAKTSLQDATPLIAAMNVALRGSGFASKETDAGEPGGGRQSARARPSKRKSAN